MAERIIRLLRQERQAILAGDFDALDGLIARKQALLAGPIDAEKARYYARQMQLNQRLLAAAIDGVKEARGRLAALDDAQDGLRIYGANGAVSHVKGPTGELERKA